MSDQSLRAAIHARMTALGPIIGRVHDYERWAADPKKFLELFQDPSSKKIFGWEISRTGCKVSKIAMQKWRWSHQYIIRGYYGLGDAAGTEKSVNALADLIVLDFTLTKLAGTQGEQLPVAAVETRMFGQYLCHVVEIRLPQVDEIIERAVLPDEYLEVVGLAYYLGTGEAASGVADSVVLWETDAEGAVSFGGSRIDLGGEEGSFATEVTIGNESATFGTEAVKW